MVGIPCRSGKLPARHQPSRGDRPRDVSPGNRRRRNRWARIDRHTLNDYLRQRGGHIGYAVLAEHRRRGYGTQILCRSIPVAQQLGIGNILISCDETNTGSRRIIESCAGQLESTLTWSDGTRILRYWIT
ncbi:GNAT family N-acetyltransferase [Nocardia sp. NPDC006630]|uniref:GNAT family N-acetyltransferase n=1 Tax=Nocardia sp. NPDC006630 TaxID=3157181 RepID=UPI0033A836B5